MVKRIEIKLDCFDQAIHINFDIDEDIEARDRSVVDGDEAAVAVVNEEVGGECGGGEVVDAASAVGDVAEDEAGFDGGEGSEDVGKDEGVHEEAFGELESDALGVCGEDSVDRFVDLEVVV